MLLALGTAVCGVLTPEGRTRTSHRKREMERKDQNHITALSQELGSLCPQATLTCRCPERGKSGFRQEK